MDFNKMPYNELIELPGTIYYAVKQGCITPLELVEVHLTSTAYNIPIVSIKFYDMLREKAHDITLEDSPFQEPLIVHETIEDCAKDLLSFELPKNTEIHKNKLKVLKDFHRLYGKIFPEEFI